MKLLMFILATMLLTVSALDNTNDDNNDDSLLLEDDNSNREPLLHARGWSSWEPKLLFPSSSFLVNSCEQEKVAMGSTCSRYDELKSGGFGLVPGRCCDSKCVDIRSDFFHCGFCRRGCRFGESCCFGRCVDLNNDRRNCGECGLRCPKRVRCEFGICGYA